MFHDIPETIRQRMRYLETRDARDRLVGVPWDERLRQVLPETGRLVAWLAAVAPQGAHLEIGTSAGYSSLWLGLACREKGARLVTFELADHKVRLAEETLRVTGMDAVIEVVQADARDHLSDYQEVAFCFMDSEKDLYQECYDAVIPNLVPGGLFVADNAISHAEVLEEMLSAALADERVDALILPVGKGVLVCRKA